MKAFVIDIARCNGCYCCQIACKDEHVGNDWSPYAKPQPDTGQFWLKLNEFVKGTVPKVKMHYQPVLCAHCDAAPCMKACKIEGAIYKREDGLVIIDQEKCNGCRNCVDTCPYHAIYFNENLNLAQKCTGCAHLLDSGWEVPRCVDACPTECLKYGEESELKDLIDKAEVMHPEFNTSPRLYYLNMPKKYVGGTVYDPAEKVVVIEAVCTLNDEKSGAKLTTTTDGFGDFWFEDLEPGDYSLVIVKDGRSKVIEPINTEKDVNLGDIPL
ncbi:4Fe-4S dicluster domain-containing protein [Chloroflexota bacterium]